MEGRLLSRSRVVSWNIGWYLEQYSCSRFPWFSCLRSWSRDGWDFIHCLDEGGLDTSRSELLSGLNLCPIEGLGLLVSSPCRARNWSRYSQPSPPGSCVLGISEEKKTHYFYKKMIFSKTVEKYLRAIRFFIFPSKIKLLDFFQDFFFQI